MEGADERGESATAEDELSDEAFDRELAERLEEELQEDEEQLEGDIEEQVVAESEPGPTRVGEAAEPSGVYASLEERTTLNRVKESAVGPDEEEFVCRSCFLVKRRTQLVDPDRLLCVDCART